MGPALKFNAWILESTVQSGCWQAMAGSIFTPHDLIRLWYSTDGNSHLLGVLKVTGLSCLSPKRWWMLNSTHQTLVSWKVPDTEKWTSVLHLLAVGSGWLWLLANQESRSPSVTGQLSTDWTARRHNPGNFSPVYRSKVNSPDNIIENPLKHLFFMHPIRSNET